MNFRILSFLPIFLSLSPAGMSFAQTIKNLVFEGGGVRGIAYAGALMELESMHKLDSVERVAGTSAGAIAATLYGLGYREQEISHIISDLRIKSFNDGRWIFIGGTNRLIKKFGWYRGERFNRWMNELIKAKTGKENLTFMELHEIAKKDKTFKDVYLTGTNLTRQTTEIFSYENYPDMEVRIAARISIGIPFYFEAIFIDEKGKVIVQKKRRHEGDVLVDGGVIANFPIHVFDYTKYFLKNGDSTVAINPQTIGMRVDSDDQIEFDKKGHGLAPFQINSFRGFTNAFYNLINENLNRQKLTKDDWARTITISDKDISPRIRQMSQEDKMLLINSGRKGVQDYFLKK